MNITNEPIDQLHADCTESKLIIRQYVNYKRSEIAKWQLPPFPNQRGKR